jgi:hypothetical protein
MGRDHNGVPNRKVPTCVAQPDGAGASHAQSIRSNFHTTTIETVDRQIRFQQTQFQKFKAHGSISNRGLRPSTLPVHPWSKPTGQSES